MSEIIVCKVNGNLGHVWQGRKKIFAMCGRIKCSSNECSLPAGKCEHQTKPNHSEQS